MSSQLWSELEQGSFEPNEFVERLAWRATSNSSSSSAGGVSMPNGVSSGEDDFDAQALHDTFLTAIQDLNLMQERQRKKCQSLEQVSCWKLDFKIFKFLILVM